MSLTLNVDSKNNSTVQILELNLPKPFMKERERKKANIHLENFTLQETQVDRLR